MLVSFLITWLYVVCSQVYILKWVVHFILHEHFICWVTILLNLQVEVRVREGRAVNIHMFCGRKPGLLLSTMRALDNLGLDIQQAVISCFNGFAMDIFRAEVLFVLYFLMCRIYS
jgi:hypothetical protein